MKTSRLEDSILTFQPVVGPLAPMLEQAVAGLQPKADRKGITLTLLPTQAQARFDPKWTEEAVCNLLDNGVKYTPTGEAVTVSVTAYELFCRIDVTDTGMGLAEEEQAKVFQRFYRAPAARDGEGVGIGLYLVRQIAAGPGAMSRYPPARAGSTFSCFFPGGLPRRRIFPKLIEIQKRMWKESSGIVCTVEGRTDYFLFGTMEEFDMTSWRPETCRKVYGAGDTEVRALDGVHLTVEKGEFVAVVGTSGSGKSTLLHMLGGLDRPTSGSVTVDGREIFQQG